MMNQLAQALHKLLRGSIILSMVAATTAISLIQGTVSSEMLTATTTLAAAYLGIKGSGNPPVQDESKT